MGRNDLNPHSLLDTVSSPVPFSSTVHELHELNLEESKSIKGKIKRWLPLIKLLLLTFIPLIALIIVSVSNLYQANSLANEKEGIKNDVSNMEILHSLMHSLENERGTACFLAGNSDIHYDISMKTILEKYWIQTDEQIVRTTFILNRSTKSCNIKVGDLKKHRAANATTCAEIFSFFDVRIQCLFEYALSQTRNSQEGHFWIDVFARSLLWYAWNLNGKKQAMGSVILSREKREQLLQDQFNGSDKIDYHTEISSILEISVSAKVIQKASAMLTADLDLGSDHNKLLSEAKVSENLAVMEERVSNLDMNHVPNSSEAVRWFTQSSESMKIFTPLNHDIGEHIREELAEAIDKLHWKFSASLIGLIVTVLFCITLSVVHGIQQHLMMAKIRNFTRRLTIKNKEIAVEKRKTENLLTQMLPKVVAERMVCGQKVDPQNFEEVTICFTDVKGFTKLCSRSSPFEIFELLHQLYRAFDQILDSYRCYKVETIGDAYMVVSGLPEKNGSQHSNEICTMSLDMMKEMKKFVIPHKPEKRLHLRIGIHTGSCAAGVVGVKMPRYCLFGDTVNTASRMESNSLTDRIQISAQTRNHLFDNHKDFNYIERGSMKFKGKGKLITYWLTGKEGFPFKIHIKPHEIEGDRGCNAK